MFSHAFMHAKADDRLPRIWLREAEYDLFEIWEHIWMNASARIADNVLKDLHHVCFVLGAWPAYGKARDDVRAGLRSVRVDRYVVFYRIGKSAVEIVRVLDERRDVDANFENLA